jgi:restriction endonuclease S subunit
LRAESVRARFLFREVAEKGHDLPLGSVTKDGGVEFRSDLNVSVWNPGDDVSGYKRVRKDDFVIGLRSFQSGIGLSAIEALVSPAYTVLRPISKQVHPPFFRYLFKSSAYISRLENVAQGIRQGRTISSEDFYNIEVQVPSLAGQKAIADYLDRETTRIDALIEKKRRLIHLVSSRTSQFVGSVCSGTNAADFEHWNRVPLKSLFSFSKGKDAQRLSGEYVGNHQGPYPVYSGQTAGDAIFGQIDTFDFDLPDGAILVATVGAEAMSCRIISGRFSLSQNCALMIPRSGTNVFLPFIVGQLRDLFLEKRSEIPDHMQPSLRIEDLNRFYVQIPSLETQESIASLVDNKWSKTSVLLKSLDSQVEKLIERRSSIVTAAVTGDLEIPEVAA